MDTECFPGNYLKDWWKCTPCDDGQFNTDPFAAECKTCPDEMFGPGTVANPGHTGCIDESDCALGGGILNDQGNQCNCPQGTLPDNITGTGYGLTCMTNSNTGILTPDGNGHINEADCGTKYPGASVVDGQCKCPVGWGLNHIKECTPCEWGWATSEDATCYPCQDDIGAIAASPGRTECISQDRCTNEIGGMHSGWKLYQCTCPQKHIPGPTGFECQSCGANEISDPANMKCIQKAECEAFGGVVHDGDYCQCPQGHYFHENKCKWCESGHMIINALIGVVNPTKCDLCASESLGSMANPGHTGCIYEQKCLDNNGVVSEQDSHQCKCESGKGRAPDTTGDACEACGEGLAAAIDNMTCVTEDQCAKSAQGAGVFMYEGRKQCRCQLGHYFGSHSTQCIRCIRNYACPDGINSTRCTGSTPVANPEHTGCIKEEQCTNGSIVDNHCVCSSGSVPKPDGTGCLACQDGEIMNDAKNACVCKGGYGWTNGKCTKCSAGTYHKQNTAGNEKGTCEPCKSGTVSLEGQEQCDACSTDTEVPNTAKSVCICASGYGVNDQGECARCGSNEWHVANPDVDTSRLACQKCTAVTQVANSANTKCICAAGYERDSTTQTCVECKAGYFKVAATEDDAACEKCLGYDDGTEVANETRTKCLCKAGYGVPKGSAIDKTKCEACGPGTYHSEPTADTDRVECKACAAGQVVNLDHTGCQSQEECTGLNSAFNTVVLSSNQCVCSAGHKVKANSTTECDQCQNGSVSAVGENKCTFCTDANKQVASLNHTVCQSEDDCRGTDGANHAIASPVDGNNKQCKCDAKYELKNNVCELTACGDHEVRGDDNTCLCAAGYGIREEGQNNCELCEDGYAHGDVKSNTTKQMCTKCDATTEVSNEIDGFRTACVCAEGYGIDKGDSPLTGVCKPCGQGKHTLNRQETEKQECTPPEECTENEVRNSSGVCVCKEGYGTNAQSTECMPCGHGTANWEGKAATTKTQCSPCTNADQVVNLDHTACQSETDCTGTDGTNNTAVDPASNGNSKQCICKAGYEIYVSRNAVCKQCADGSASAQGANKCTVCADSRKVANLLKTECIERTACGQNTADPVMDNQCKCADTYQLKGSTCEPTSCGANEIRAHGGKCVCKDGYGTNNGNDCVECASGTVHKADLAKNTEKVACTICKNTEVANNINGLHTTCLCAENYGIDTQNQTECKPCVNGTKHDVDLTKDVKEVCVNTTPTGCKADTEIDGAGGACVCADGYGIEESADVTTGTCESCPAGTYHTADTTKTKKEICTPCPNGTVNPGIGQAQCTILCTQNELPNNKRTVCVCKGGYGHSNGTCAPCPDDMFHEENVGEEARVSCKACGAGLVPNKEKTECVTPEVEKSTFSAVPIVVCCVIGLLVLITIITVTAMIVKKRRNKLIARDTEGISYYNRRVRKDMVVRDSQKQTGTQHKVNVSNISESLSGMLDEGRIQKIETNRHQQSGHRSAMIVGPGKGRL